VRRIEEPRRIDRPAPSRRRGELKSPVNVSSLWRAVFLRRTSIAIDPRYTAIDNSTPTARGMATASPGPLKRAHANENPAPAANAAIISALRHEVEGSTRR